MWEYQRQCGSINDSVGVSTTVWEYQRQCGSINDIVGVSTTLWEYQRQCGSINNTQSGFKTMCVKTSLSHRGGVTVNTVPNMFEVFHGDCKFPT